MKNRLSTQALIVSSALFASTLSAQADTLLGIYGDVSYWNQRGNIEFAQPATDQNFDFDRESTAMISLAVEHGVPLLPNIKAKHVQLDSDKTQDVNLTLQNTTFNTDTTADLDVSLTDVIAYYELLDNIVSVDLGIAAKIIDGKVMVNDANNELAENVSETVPALYAAVGAKLPFTGLSIHAEASGLGYEDNSLIDAQAEIQYDFVDNVLVDIGVKLGYRIVEVKLDDVLDTQVEDSFKGGYIGVAAHF